MKIIMLATAMVISWMVLAETVTNVRGVQRENSYLVDIYYDLNASEGCSYSVEVGIKDQTNDLNATSFTGEVGDGVVPGKNRHILWDAGADLPNRRCDVKVVVTATIMTTANGTHDKIQLWENGPYWATTNIGANEPWEYGYYFWWGDTVGYKHENDTWVASDGSSDNFQFYFDPISQQTYYKTLDTLQGEGWIITDNVLAPNHDAANVHWGEGWRIPTYQELCDLCYNKCDWVWTTTNGVYGCVVRGRGESTSSSIFLPCAGFGHGTSLYSSGSDGRYWSSVPYSDNQIDYSWYLYFDSSGHNTYHYLYRPYGISVRPVCESAMTVGQVGESALFSLNTIKGSPSTQFNATWYVDATTGNATNSGTSMSDAFKEIQTAINKSSAGDTIIVNDGTYSPINTQNKLITIQSINGATKTIIDGGGSTRCASLWLEDTKWYEWNTNVVLSGFTLRNGYASKRGGGVKDGTLHDCIITNCKVPESGSGAGAYRSALHNCTIMNNSGLGNYSAGGGTYYCDLYFCEVKNNSAPQGGGIMDGFAFCCLISNNKATRFEGGGMKNLCAYGCIAYGNTAAGGGGGAEGCSLYNCTITKNSASQGGGAYSSGVYNSIIWGNSASVDADVSQGSCYCTCSGSQLNGSRNIVSNPRFVNPSAYDFSLADDSPCINAGSNNYAQRGYSENDGYTTKSYSFGRTDITGKPRIKGKTVDMGAFENQTASPGAEVGYASAKQRYPWNGLVDIAFDVFGLPDDATTNIVMTADGDLLEGLPLSTFPEQGLSGLSN